MTYKELYEWSDEILRAIYEQATIVGMSPELKEGLRRYLNESIEIERALEDE